MFSKPEDEPYPIDAQQREMESEAEIQADEGWSSPMSTQDPQLTKWTLTPDELLEFIEHELRGEDFDFETKKWMIKSKAIMNETGVRQIISIIRHHVNKIFFLSNLDEPQIYDMMFNLSNNLTQLLFNNGTEFEIDWSKGHQNFLVDNVCDLVFAGLRKSYDQGERKFLGSHTKVLHRIDEGGPQMVQKRHMGVFG